jgi:uncharacterized protein YfaS (alpha-2-macroglobulin family)
MRMMMWLITLIVAGLAIVLPFATAWGAGAEKTVGQLRAAFSQGNYKDAYDGLSPRLTGGKDTDDITGDFNLCVNALNSLGRTDEIDAFREKVVAAHSNDWQVLLAVAQSYRDQMHFGVIISGEFHRGNNRNRDGKWVSSVERDRVRALQLMMQAAAVLKKAAPPPPTGLAASFYYEFATMLLMGESGQEAWRLQALTDLSTLPDYDEGGMPYYYRPWREPRGAPVDEKGNPIFHRIPKGEWEGAATDGERWRWVLLQASEMSVEESFHAQTMLAQFWQSQLGVETMAGYARLLGGGDEDGKKDKSGPYAVSTLKDEETIARLANGIKRFALPNEFNPIKIYQTLATDGRAGTYAEGAMDALARIYENRQQYNTAEDWWKKAIARFGPGNESFRQKALDQIVGNWGMFENSLVQPAASGKAKNAADGAQVEYRFRNATRASFTATEIDIPKLLADLKTYIQSNPNQLDWQMLQIDNVGYRLVEKDEKKYLQRQAAQWDLTLEPRANHFDKRITVQTPLTKPGAYLLSATTEAGADGAKHTTRIMVWVTDTVIVSKPLNGKTLTYVADAVTGKAAANAKVDFWGYRQVYLRDRNYRIDTQSYVTRTNADGEVITPVAAESNDRVPAPIDPKKPVMATGLNWITTVTTDAAEGGRFAFMGFAGVWGAQISDAYDSQYNQLKAFIMTDRPVYRPGQKVQFKMWVGNNKYDQDGPNPHAGEAAAMEVRNPRGDLIKTVSGNLDQWGGIAGEMMLDANAALGVYQINFPNRGGVSFRVEEYKKPEFEVKVDAPSEPVMLGEKISATINAKYYFGSPVTNATVKYKVTRTAHDARWYPVAYWDWYYEPGYWWFAHDYLWYPGFARWGCLAPIHHWWPGGWSNEQPEVISENEVPIGPDGTVKVEIDTAVAKAAYGDQDHRYSISAEVTDESRRTITGSGDVLVAQDPFKVYAWVDHGYYHAGDAIDAHFMAQTLDNKPVKGAGALKLLRINYDKDGKPTETAVGTWSLDTNERGEASQQIKAGEAGQYRLSYSVSDNHNRVIEGGYIFAVRGEKEADAADGFRFNDVEVTTEKKEYAAGEKVRLMVSTAREDATVLLFVRPSNGVYLEPKVIQLKGKSAVEEIEVGKKDMPNFFVEAVTVGSARVFNDVREVIVPPEDRVLNVAVTSDATEYKPGQKATLTLKVTEKNGEPFTGSAVLSLYDKAVEYISGGSNVGDIRKYFWQWRRAHYVSQTTSDQKYSGQVLKNGETGMGYLGVFGYMLVDYGDTGVGVAGRVPPGGAVKGFGGGGGLGGAVGGRMMQEEMPVAAAAAPMMVGAPMSEAKAALAVDRLDATGGAIPPSAGVEPTIRSNFADTALWAPSLVTATNGTATVDVKMPENLTTWKAKVWSFGNGSRVGQGETDVVTRKNLIVRLEAPRFFVQNDEVTLSAIVHNYLKTAKQVTVRMALEGQALESTGPIRGPVGHSAPQAIVEIPANGEQRIDFPVRAVAEGMATVTMLAITDEESDAMKMSFPVYVHGMLKTESFAGALRPMTSDPTAILTESVKFNVPKERRPEQTRFEVWYSPTLAGAMVDALPYLVDYPYGCTEQTLNKFVPTVITQKILLDMKLDLAAIQAKRTNLNAQELGGDRAKQWGAQESNGFEVTKWKNPVFDHDQVKDMVREGVTRLSNMQLSDGGWGWFSGYGEQSYPHTTALVVHGLQMARDNGAAVDPQVIDRGVQWLVNDQAKRLAWIQAKREERKAWDTDAFEYMVLVDAGRDSRDMREILYQDRNALSVYTKAMFGLALQKVHDPEKLNMILNNLRQYVVQDDENQTAYLKLPAEGWWYWYGSEFEAHAYYLKLLARTDPKGDVASRLAKYLINNRRHGTYWNSTRDTAICIEALADFVRGSGEAKPDMTVKLTLDGKPVKSERITAENLFTFDNSFVVEGAEGLTDGPQTLEISREGSGPLYYNAYLTNFTLEDPIRKAGLEIKVTRKIYKLTEADKTVKSEGSHGQALDKKVEHYTRTEISSGQEVKSGDLLEIELSVDSKNDYEYILLEDMKAAGTEPVEVRSGYNGNDIGAYVEFRDNRVAFFVRELGRGAHSVAYRLRAEVPGVFAALPTKASAMYAPELRANSDEDKVRIVDK